MVARGEKEGQSRPMPSGTNVADRPFPHDPVAERSVLGAMLLEPNPCIQTAYTLLGGDNPVFHLPRHQRIYTTLCRLADQGNPKSVDMVTVSHALRQDNALEEIGGESYLAELATAISTSANLEAWCQLVRNYAVLRRLISTCEEIRGRCFELDRDTEVGDLLDEVERTVLDVRNLGQRQPFIKLPELVKGGFEYLVKLNERSEETAGIKTGFTDLDNLILGMKNGEMFVLAARPSIGKTAFALNLVSNIVLHRKNSRSVGFFSLEMTAEQISRRLLCTESGYSEQDFYHGDFNVTKLSKAATELAKAELFIDPTPALKIMELRAKARRMHSLHHIQLIVIDYLQLMRAEGMNRNDNRQSEVQRISSGIKALAKELNVPVLVLAQLNREAEKTATGKPRLSHLRESGAIEQDADIVAFLHRERDAQRDSDPESQKKGLDAELIIEKNRNGRTGIVELLFFPRTTLFRSKTRYSEKDMPSQ